MKMLHHVSDSAFYHCLLSEPQKWRKTTSLQNLMLNDTITTGGIHHTGPAYSQIIILPQRLTVLS